MLQRRNPIDISVVGQVGTDGAALEKQIAELVERVKSVDADLLGWLYKQLELVKLRLGIRAKKSVPWAGSANISVPLIDGIIRRWRPGIVSLVLDANPVAFFHAQSPSDIAPARLAEQFFTFLFRDQMQTHEAIVQLVDLIAWRGHAYTRQSWDYRTEREARIVEVARLFPPDLGTFLQQALQLATEQGVDTTPEDVLMSVLEEEFGLDRQGERDGPALLATVQQILAGAAYVKLVYRRVKRDLPGWQVVDPINVIVPQDQPPEEAEFFTVVHHMGQDQVRALGIDGYLDRGRVEELLRAGADGQTGISGTAREQIRDLSNRKAGMDGRVADPRIPCIVLWEIYARLDINGDGERERCVVWYAPEHNMPLAVLDYVFPTDTWPVTYYPFESAARPVDNRGLAEMLRPFQKIASALRNAALDASQILLAPVLQMRQAGGNYKKSIRWAPGAIIPVTQIGDIAPITMDLRILAELLAQEQINQRLAETYVGVFDATINSLQQTKERRTAAEINAITQVSSNIFGLDAKTFTNALSRSFTQIWQLWEEFGPEEFFFRVQEEPMPRLSKRNEIARSYDIRASGTPATTNRAFQIATLERAMQVIMSNPMILQSGRVDWAGLLEQWLALVDHKLSRSILLDPEQAASVQAILQAAQLSTGAEAPPL